MSLMRYFQISSTVASQKTAKAYKTRRSSLNFTSLSSKAHRRKIPESSKYRNHYNMRSASKFNAVFKICIRNYGFTAIRRDYGPEVVEKLRGSLKIEQTLARRGAERLWELINRGEDSYVNALGAMTGYTNI